MKNLKNIDFEQIFTDIQMRNFSSYDMKKLRWHTHLYRIRIGWYRIVFFDDMLWEARIISFDKRSQVYRGLKNL